MSAPPRDLAPHQRIAIGPNRLGIRRDVEPGVVAAHLMVIDVGLRHPLAIHQPPEVLRLRQVEREAVAVVVVAGVFLVEPGKVGGPCGVPTYSCPVGNHLCAVRVDRRRDDADDVVEDLLRLESVRVMLS